MANRGYQHNWAVNILMVLAACNQICTLKAAQRAPSWPLLEQKLKEGEFIMPELIDDLFAQRCGEKRLLAAAASYSNVKLLESLMTRGADVHQDFDFPRASEEKVSLLDLSLLSQGQYERNRIAFWFALIEKGVLINRELWSDNEMVPCARASLALSAEIIREALQCQFPQAVVLLLVGYGAGIDPREAQSEDINRIENNLLQKKNELLLRNSSMSPSWSKILHQVRLEDEKKKLKENQELTEKSNKTLQEARVELEKLCKENLSEEMTIENIQEKAAEVERLEGEMAGARLNMFLFGGLVIRTEQDIELLQEQGRLLSVLEEEEDIRKLLEQKMQERKKAECSVQDAIQRYNDTEKKRREVIRQLGYEYDQAREQAAVREKLVVQQAIDNEKKKKKEAEEIEKREKEMRKAVLKTVEYREKRHEMFPHRMKRRAPREFFDPINKQRSIAGRLQLMEQKSHPLIQQKSSEQWARSFFKNALGPRCS
jgi:hypothetical protein